MDNDQTIGDGPIRLTPILTTYPFRYLSDTIFRSVLLEIFYDEQLDWVDDNPGQFEHPEN